MRQAVVRVLLVVVFLVLVPCLVGAQTVHVPADYPTIQAAINSGASEVRVADGTYHERLVVSESVHLFPEESDNWPGVEWGFPVVDSMVIEGGCCGGPIVYVRGFHFLGAVRRNVRDCGGTTVIEACRLDGGFAQQALCPISANVVLRGCLIRGGVSIWGGGVNVFACTVIDGGLDVNVDGGGTVTDNYVVGSATVGIRAPSHDGSTTIRDNTVLGAGAGIVAYMGPVSDNIVRGCTDRGIQLTVGSASGNVVEDCAGDGYQAVGTYHITNVQLSYNTARRCGGHGFNVIASAEGHGSAAMIGNVADTVGLCGIHAGPGSELIADSNAVRASGGVGIWIEGSGDATHNRVLGAESDGIWAPGLVEGNVVGRSSGTGVVAPSASHNTSYLNHGAGFELSGSDPGAVSNNIGFGNTGYGLVWTGTGAQEPGCNDWFGNGAGATSGISPGATDLAMDPLFCAVDDDSVTLMSDSPALNASGCGLIGALGQGCIDRPTSTLTPGGGSSPGSAQAELRLLPISPSPAMGNAMVAFTLPTAMNVRLTVLDVQGRSLASLVGGWQEAGKHEVRWNPHEHAGPGIYFVRLEAAGHEFTQRIPLLN